MKRLLTGIRNILLWSYERGTWQYDLLCLLIIAAILLLPGSYFGDRDRPLRTTHISAAGGGASEARPDEAFKSAPETADLRHWDVEAAKLSAFAARINQPEALRRNTGALLELYLREKVRVDVRMTRFEARTNARGEINSYRVWFE
jgi:hypothetical protein